MPDIRPAGEEITPLQARLRELVDAAGGSTEFARVSGVPRDTLNKYLAGMQPKPDALIRLADAGNVTIDELVGRRSRSAGSGTAARTMDQVLPVAQDFIVIPRLDVQASAGTGRAVLSEGRDDARIGFREALLRDLGVQPRFAEIIFADGDSMEPTIRHGDMLLVNRAIDRVRSDGVYVFVMAGLVSVKRLQLVFDGSLRIISDNKEHYPPQLVPASDLPDLTVIGEIVWIGRRLK